MVAHYTIENANVFALNHGLTAEQAKLIINYMEGHGYHLFDYDADDECREPNKEYQAQLYRLDINDFAYKNKIDHITVEREPLYVFDGFLDEYSISEAVITVREWIWDMMNNEEHRERLLFIEALEDDDFKLAAITLS